MHAGRVLQEWVGEVWSSWLDRRLIRRLLGAVDAWVASRQLVLMELARQYPGALRVAAPLKALDRLLSNPRLQRVRFALYQSLWMRLWPVAPVWIVVDWCTLKREESLHLLRAALPVGGRALSLWDEVHPQAKLGNERVHRGFLATLRRLLPWDRLPILITDAGFKVPWFRAAEGLGFACIGRLRGRVQLRPVGESEWVAATDFSEIEGARVIDLGVCEVSKGQRQRLRVVVCKRPPRGRKHRTVQGRVAQRSGSRTHARAAREPWGLAVSTALAHLDAEAIVAHYARRMQIEERFRDIKSARFGTGLRHSLTRKAARMEVLILLHALASVVAWLRGLMARQAGEDKRLMAHAQAIRQRHRTLSVWRIGWEILKRGWPPAEPPDPLPMLQPLLEAP